MKQHSIEVTIMSNLSILLKLLRQTVRRESAGGTLSGLIRLNFSKNVRPNTVRDFLRETFPENKPTSQNI